MNERHTTTNLLARLWASRLPSVVALAAAVVFGANAVATAGNANAPSTMWVLPEAVRVIDTREGDALPATIAPGVAGRPVWATVAIVHVAVVEPTAPGFLTLWNCDGPAPDVAHLNYGAGAAASGMAFAPLGPGGELCAHVGGGGTADVVVDVQGWTMPATTAFPI